MKLMEQIKWYIKSILESHPVGYYLGNKMVNLTNFFLPHEEDFHGFRALPIPENGLFLDIGANDGKSARSYKKLFRRASVFSVEANPFHENTLSKLKNKLSHFNFIIGAIANEDAQLTLYTPIYKNIIIHSAASVFLDQVKYQMKKQFKKQSITDRIRYIETVTQPLSLDALNLSPNVIKIDIEGMEFFALKDLENTIMKSRPYVLVEYNPRNFTDVKKFMLEKNYKACGYDIKNNVFVEFNNTFRNCFFIPVV